MKSARIVAMMCAAAFAANGKSRLAWAEGGLDSPATVAPDDATACAEWDGDGLLQDDPWAATEGLEPPASDPWGSPQQVQRGGRLGQRDGLVFKSRITPHWFGHDHRFWYRNDLAGGAKEFVVVDAEHGSRQPAFDHQKLAGGLSKTAGGEAFKAETLPFDAIEYTADGKSIQVVVGKTTWKCDLATYECTKIDGNGVSKPPVDEPDPSAQERRVRGRRDGAGEDFGRSGASWVRSPDGQWEASVKSHNIVVRHTGDVAKLP